MLTARRPFLTGLAGFVACAPAIVRASSLMPVKSFKAAAVPSDFFLIAPRGFYQILVASGPPNGVRRVWADGRIMFDADTGAPLRVTDDGLVAEC